MISAYIIKQNEQGVYDESHTSMTMRCNDPVNRGAHMMKVIVSI